MPYVKRKYTKKRKAIKKYTPKPTKALSFNTNVVLGKGLPAKLQATHKFFHSGTLTSSSGTPSVIGTEEFIVNGMFQPVLSGATHQPLYFDQLSALYNNYYVIGSKITFTLTTVGNAAIIGLFMNDTTAALAPTLMSTMIEQTKGKYVTLPFGSTDTTKKLSLNWSARKRFGKSPLANTELGGTSSANPITDPSYVIAIQNPNKTSGTSVEYTVEIEYIAVWLNLKDIAGS